MTAVSKRRLPTALLSLVLAALAWSVPTAVAAQSACGGYYVVQSGDTLSEIAARCGVSLPALLAANKGVSDNMDLEAGNRVAIPGPDDPEPTPIEACGPYYTVRSGDTMAEIADKCGVPIPLLVAANPPLPQPVGLRARMSLRIPPVTREAADDPATVAVPGRTAAGAAAGAAAEPDAADPQADPDADPHAESPADSAAAAAPGESPMEDLTRVEGVLVEGSSCMRVESPDGAVVGITGDVNAEIAPGSRVVLLGVPADEHSCATDRALELRILYRQR